MDKKQPAKRINIVTLKTVRESSVLYDKRKITAPQDAAELFTSFIADSDREKFIILCLDTKNQPQAISTISVGSLNSSIVHPREVFKIAILSNSAAIILCHNHPLGDPQPSQEDVAVTKRLVEAGKIIGIDVLDSIIVGSKDKFCSLKEKDLI